MFKMFRERDNLYYTDGYGGNHIHLIKRTKNKIRHRYKKNKYDKLKELIENDIIFARLNGINFFFAEDIAYKYNVKIHYVKQILQELNLEGKISQPYHKVPHDVYRHGEGWWYSSWGGNIYYVR